MNWCRGRGGGASPSPGGPSGASPPVGPPRRTSADVAPHAAKVLVEPRGGLPGVPSSSVFPLGVRAVDRVELAAEGGPDRVRGRPVRTPVRPALHRRTRVGRTWPNFYPATRGVSPPAESKCPRVPKPPKTLAEKSEGKAERPEEHGQRGAAEGSRGWWRKVEHLPTPQPVHGRQVAVLSDTSSISYITRNELRPGPGPRDSGGCLRQLRQGRERRRQAQELHGLPARQVLRSGLPEGPPQAAQEGMQGAGGRAEGRATVQPGA
ncbi:hypothetical protein THAOC_08700 [Thalassiosira oceanica]|uniref:Uncharacterized protein n=1 Tax=Thalassiosira oceanica TaxID=159749 RepID=K0SUA5_THAOC|nr:hypothetical protein THAOC_08700 [Thalassiosira oceanica]|eukprot:EJK69983.1 hypothetical protein THAOC_08700 [Thalassiosira oceanica]